MEALIPDRTSGSEDMVPLTATGESKIPLDDITVNPYQPRGRFDPERMREMVQSVREMGLVQPILVRPQGDKYQIVAGERRFRAAKEAGLKSIPAVIREIDDREMLEIALIENLQREDLNPVDEAEAYRVLHERYEMTQAEIAERVGKNRSTVANTMRLLRLPEEIRRSVSRGTLSMGHARAMLSLDSRQQQIHLAREIETRNLSVRDVEKRIHQRTAGKREADGSRSPEIVEIEQRMQRWLGTRVRIAERKGRGRIVVEFYNGGDLERIVDCLRSGSKSI